MNENNKEKCCSDCDNTVLQITRFRSTKRSLEDLSIDALDTKESHLAKLPSDCLQRILSFLTYEKVSQIRQVCTAFNEIGKNLLNNGHRKLEKQLKREIERAEKMILFPTDIKSSYDMLRFLKGLCEAINNCTKTYAFHLLVEGNCLLKDFNSSTMIPYFQEHVCDKQQHPFLASIVAHSKRAHQHFEMEILKYFIYYDEEASFERFQQNELEMELQFEEINMRLLKINLLKSQKQKANCGNEVKREFFKLILKLNENLLDLTQWAKEMGDEMGQIINKMNMSTVSNNKEQSNCLVYLSTPSRSLLSSTQPNLSTLPLSCIQCIISYLNCDKMSQLRMVCKSFDKICKKELNHEFEKLKQNLGFKIKYIEKKNMLHTTKIFNLEKNMMKDACSLLQLCNHNFKWHLGKNYYFAAGKILDEAKCLYNELDQRYDVIPFLRYLDQRYIYRPYFSLFLLMDLVYKAIAHFKFYIVPKYFPSTENPLYVPDYIITGDVMNFEKVSQLNLEEIQKLLKIEDLKIKEQNVRNKKFVKLISGLKKKIVFLKCDISKTMNALNELE